MSVKEGFLTLIKLVVAFGVLYYIFSKIPLSAVMVTVITSKINYVMTAFIISIFIQILLAYRLKLLTDEQGMSLSISQVLEIHLCTVFYGLFLPGGSLGAGAIRFYKLSRSEKKIAESFAAIAFDRMVATIAICVIGIVFWSLDFPSDSGYVGLVMIVALGGLLTLHSLLFIKRPSLFFHKLSRWLNLSSVYPKIRNLVASMDRYKNLSLSAVAMIAILSIAAHLFGILIYYLLARSIRMDISFISIAWIRSVVTIITMIPISVSGVGIREGSLVFLLRPFGIFGEKAVSLSLLVFGTTVLLIGITGGLLEARKLLLPTASKA
jgi:uncharacterized protein (TIRG00374 family)